MQAQYAADLQEVSSAFDACMAAGACDSHGVIRNADGQATPMAIGSLHPDGLIQTVSGLVSSVPNAFCSLAQGMTSETFNNLWWFMGNNVSGAVPGIAAISGEDIAFDLWNKQAAGFVYEGGTGSASTSFGVGSSAYEGFAMGTKNGVLDGWSGTFVSVNYSVNVSIVKLIGAGVSYSAFCDPQMTICGGAVSADVGLSFNLGITPPVSAGYSVSDAQWVGYDPLTQDLASSPWFGFGFNATVAPDKDYGKNLVTYGDGKSLAYAILGSAGLTSPVAVALAVGVAALKASGGTVESICGTTDGGVPEAGAGTLVGP